nr:DNA cytosine methyltransferase [Streptomyces sulphureus]
MPPRHSLRTLPDRSVDDDRIAGGQHGPLIGSLCSGYGGLDLGVQAAVGGTLAWHAETDPDTSRILAHHWPGVPNLGDITNTNWSDVPRVCVLTAGFPCQRRLDRRTPRRTAGRQPLRAVAPHRGRHQSPRPLPGGDRKRSRTPHLTRRLRRRPGTVPVVSGRRHRPACCAGTRCRTRFPGRPPA